MDDDFSGAMPMTTPGASAPPINPAINNAPNLGASTLTGTDGSLTSAAPATNAAPAVSNPVLDQAADKAKADKVANLISDAGKDMNKTMSSAGAKDAAAFSTIFGHTNATPTPTVSAPITGPTIRGTTIDVGNPGQIAATPMIQTPQVPQTTLTSDRNAKTRIRSGNEGTAQFLTEIMKNWR